MAPGPTAGPVAAFAGGGGDGDGGGGDDEGGMAAPRVRKKNGCLSSLT